MRRFLKYAAAALLASLLVLAGALLVVTSRPDLVLNDRTGAWALKRFGGALRPLWRSLAVRASSEGPLLQILELDARGLCLSGERPPWKACFDRLRVRGRFAFGLSGLEELRLEEVVAEVRELDMDLSKPVPPGAVAARREASPAAPAWLRKLRLGRLRVDSPDNRVALASATALGSLRLELPERGPRVLEVAARGTLESPQGPERLSLSGRVDTDAWEGRLSRLGASVELDAASRGSASVNVRVRPRPDGPLELSADARARLGESTLELELSAAGDRSRARGSWSARYRDPKGALRAAALEGCGTELGFGEDSPWPPRSGALRCRWRVEPKPLGAAAPKRLAGVFAASGASDERRNFSARARLSVEPGGDWYRFQGRLALGASGRAGGGRRGLRLEHEAEAEVSVPRFERLVEYFRDTAFAVPAPLNVLQGPLRVRLKGSGDSRSDPQRFAIDGSADLKNTVQRARVRLSGELRARQPLEPGRTLEADLELSLEDVALQLPYLELQSPPKLGVDPRITLGKLPEAEARELREVPRSPPRPSPLKATLRLRTPLAPVRLHTNLVEDPVPLRLDLMILRPGGLAGTIAAEPFGLELFRRKALVERFLLRQSSASAAGDLDASIRYDTPEATIRILLLGSTAKPRVHFMSEPPMDRSQILALLLFGRAPSALDSEEQSTLGATNAALRERAFGLASLFVFASTPIEFVGYNPESQSYVVRFRLPGGATAELGSDLEERRRLRVRKRLTRNWALETELRREEATERNAVQTFLEWFRRY